MNVLHISATDNLGGAARAAFRIHVGLQRLGVTSRMLVGVKSEKDRAEIDVIPNRATFARRFGVRLIQKIEQVTGLEYQLLPWAAAFTDHPFVRQADVIHLHNLHGGFFPMRALPRLGKKLVWSLHDLWPLTGHCYFPGMADCERWKTGCGACPLLKQDNYYPLSVDTTHRLWKRKKALYDASDLTVVAQSRWTRDEIAQSPLLSKFRSALIPYALDTEVFRPIDRTAARRALNLPVDKKVLFFSAVALGSPRKGWTYLREALRLARERYDGPVVLLTAGMDSLGTDVAAGYQVEQVGFVNNDRFMAQLYSAADLFVNASQMETFGQVYSEAMACGVPQVAFDNTGVRDVVRHEKTGYLARNRDAADLAEGIVRLLSDDALRARMAQESRRVAEAEYALAIQATRFLELYSDLAGARTGA
jgi:glycosyltransferase involved in cell wall biosynthesis